MYAVFPQLDWEYAISYNKSILYLSFVIFLLKTISYNSSILVALLLFTFYVFQAGSEQPVICSR
jgi:hypothetical protein